MQSLVFKSYYFRPHKRITCIKQSFVFKEYFFRPHKRNINAQADLNLHWAHIAEGRFSDVSAERPLAARDGYMCS